MMLKLNRFLPAVFVHLNGHCRTKVLQSCLHSASQDPIQHHGISTPTYVRLRGLPFSKNPRMIVEKFFTGLHILDIVFFKSPKGYSLSEAMVQFPNQDMLSKALKMHKNTIETRYIEVYQSDLNSWNYFKDREKFNDKQSFKYGFSHRWYDEYTLHMKGLPYSADNDQIKQFFAPIIPTMINIYMKNSRPSGIAFVSFSTLEDVEEALLRHKNYMGKRYIELYRTKQKEKPDEEYLEGENTKQPDV